MILKNKKINYKLIIFILCHILLIAGMFLFVKKEYHSDEIWSFGIANGSQAGAIFQDAEEKPINNNQWISAEVIHENLTVQENERFRFGMTYQNSVDDAHPPLSFLLIHLVASFFPDVFSFWFYIIFNIVALVLCDIYIYKILKLYDLPEYVCLGICAFYALCAGGINTMMYIRMYALLVAFAVIALYLSMKVYHEKKVTKKDAIGLIVCCILGGLTEYEFFVYAFILTVWTGLLLLFHKKIKEMIKYGFCMAGGVGICLILYPEFFNDVLRNTSGSGFDALITYSYGLQLKFVIHIICRDVFGINTPVLESYGVFVQYFLIALYCMLVITPMILLLRKTPIIKNSTHKLKNVCKDIFRNLKKYHYIISTCLVECIVMIAMFSGMISVYHMGETSSRYFFVIFPAAVLSVLLIVYCIMNSSSKKFNKILYIGILVFFCILSNKNGLHNFVGQNTLEGQNIKNVKNSNIIVVNKFHGEIERIAYMMDASNYFFSVNLDDLDEYAEDIKDMPLNADVYLVLSEGALTKTAMTDAVTNAGSAMNYGDFDYEKIEKDNEEKFIQQLKEVGICNECTYMGREEMLNSNFLYYRLER